MIWSIPEKFHAVDAHTHLNMMPGKDYNALRTEAALAMLADGDRLGIEKFCISLPYITPRVTPEEFRRGNDIVFDALKLSPRYTGFCFIDPAFMKESCDEIRRCVRDGGMAGVKLYHQFRIDDPVFEPVFKLCEELDCPVLMHAVKGEHPKNLSNASHFLTACRRFPGVRFLQGHIGGGGDWEWTLRVLEKSTPNHYIDTSGSVIDPGMIRRTVEVMGSDRVLFATDMFIPEGVGKLLAADLDDETMKKVCCENVKKLLAGRLR